MSISGNPNSCNSTPGNQIHFIGIPLLLLLLLLNQVNPSSTHQPSHHSSIHPRTHTIVAIISNQLIPQGQRLRQLTHRSSTSGDGHLCRKPSKTSTATSWRGRPYPKQLSIMSKTANAEKILFSWTIVIVNFILLTSNFYIT